MIGPETYRKQQEGKTIEELIFERMKLINKIIEYERNNVINKNSINTGIIVDPSPKVVYQMNNLYLKEITDLIIQHNR